MASIFLLWGVFGVFGGSEKKNTFSSFSDDLALDVWPSVRDPCERIFQCLKNETPTYCCKFEFRIIITRHRVGDRDLPLWDCEEELVLHADVHGHQDEVGNLSNRLCLHALFCGK